MRRRPGINLKAENFDRLEAALNEEIRASYTEEDFEQRIYVSEEISEPFSEKFAHDAGGLMEPYGVGHRRPQFSHSGGGLARRGRSNICLRTSPSKANISS